MSASIYSEMSQLAVDCGAVNLGQGFPEEPGPVQLMEAACAAIRSGANQYPPTLGLPALREAVAGHQAAYYGIELDPAREIVVTAGASEGITAALLGLLEPGDEVLIFEPFYDLYPAAVRLARGVAVFVPWEPVSGGPDLVAAAAAVSRRTKAVIVNTPGNPSGRVWDESLLDQFAGFAVEHDLTVISDEVYEHIVFDGHRHRCVASRPGMAPRTLTVSSAGKSFSVTGWKVGWVSGPARMVDRVHEVKQYLSFAFGAPFQTAVAEGLRLGPDYFAALAADYQRRRDLLLGGLRRCGFTASAPEGGYFVLADCAPLGYRDAREFCRTSPVRLGVVGIPADVYFHQRDGDTLVRFTFAKSAATIQAGIDRMQGAGPRA
ncbi:aminotransferase class I/II-fold pyridoxal phosphate-dependent enzyme [Streptomyces sp. NPDC051219]|uniref:aminotransferase class I/II-fold pyridoxal phosphate-dependent enzyme n=1 Tax=Streptomyces sp. NPDC051219 TaxID=3155283 RepID=UPI00342D6612